MINSPLKLIETIKKESKCSDTCFLIGGGPSVNDIIPDPSIIQCQDVYVCNNAYKLFPNAILLHFADKIWWEWHNTPKHNVLNNFNGYITTAAKAQISYYKPWYDRVTVFNQYNGKNSDQMGLSNDSDSIYGTNAGHQLLNIVHLIGYKQICLIGYDCNPNVNQTQWHTDHKRPTNKDRYNVFSKGFEAISKSRKGIFNLNRQSAITCFPFADLKDFI